MTAQQIKINHINSLFYNTIAESFVSSRQKPWKGWDILIPELKKLPANFSLADIGCGNGRFLTYLRSNQINTNYEGFDISSSLLNIAKKTIKDATFTLFDITKDSLIKSYDVILMMGVLHHIQDAMVRNNIFENIANHLNKEGYLIFSIWNFDITKEKTFNNKADTYELKLGENDYLLDWGGNGNNIRFCHHYNENEISAIIDTLRINDITLVKRFKEDKSNEYFIFKKNNLTH